MKGRGFACLFLALLLLKGTVQSHAQYQRLLEDPSCATPSRFNLVLAGRSEAARQHRLSQRQRGVSAFATQPPAVALDWDRASNRPKLSLRGGIGRLLQLDSAESLLSPWQPLLGLQLAASDYTWLDESTTGAQSRFYRVLQYEDFNAMDPLDNFQLLDQEGKARELFYHTNLKGIVLLAAGDSSEQLAPALAALQPLAASYESRGIVFWVLLNDPDATRESVRELAMAAGSNIPVLLDPSGFGSRAAKLTRAGELAVIRPTLNGLPVFNAIYRGEFSTGGSETNPYLGEALEHLANNAPLRFFHTGSRGAQLAAWNGETPSYERDVAPILNRHCALCHRPNDVAPFAMTSYETVSSWAPVIKHALLSGEMPPWRPDPHYGTWSNSVAIPAEAKSTILRWIDAGAPRGEGPDPLAELPLPRAYTEWPAELGEPDAIIRVPLQQVRANGIEPYRYIFVQTPNPTNVWLRAAIIRPSNPAVVHHYLVWTGQVGNQSPVEGLSTYESSIADYAPGMKPHIYPSDAGYSLTASNWLTFNLHYTPNGEATTDQPELALWFHKTKPPKTYRSFSVNWFFFEIPPGASEHPAEATWTAPREVRLHRLNPHMHLRGKRAKYEAIYTDGTRKTLLSVPDYSFRWQIGYELAEPLTIPAGTKIRISGAWDNSPQNLSNPDPSATVFWGDQSSSEMFAMFIDYAE